MSLTTSTSPASPSAPTTSSEKTGSGLIKFEPAKMTWRWWQFQYRNYVKLRKITDIEDQKCLLLDALGIDAGEMLFSMCLPGNPDDFTVAQIVDKLEHAYVKKTNAATEWANYFKLRQEAGETLLDFSNRLRRKALPCAFPADVLEKNMSATFLNGISSDATRQHLQSQTYNTLEKALEICEEYELRKSNKKGQTAPDVTRVDNARSGGGGASRGRGRGRGSMQNRSSRPDRKPATARDACDGCGSMQHERSQCWAKDLACKNCGKKGHIAKVCRSGKQPAAQQRRDGRRTFLVEEEFDVLSVDTTDGRSIHVPVIGTATVEVAHARTCKSLPIVVVAKEGNVLGRDWIRALDLSRLSLRDLQSTMVSTVSGTLEVEQLLKKRSAVFRDELGHCKHYKAHLHLKPGATPVFRKARPVPFAFREALERDLDRLVERGILTPVKRANWAAVVTAQKRARDIRTCADLSTGLNDALDVQQYPLPTPDELFAKLNGGKQFSTLDLAEAYAQVELDEESKNLVVINTHKGLFRYNRLPFGVACCPSVFQQIMESALQGCEGVAVYLDDIIVTGATEEEHLRNLEKVLQRLEEHARVSPFTSMTSSSLGRRKSSTSGT
ncbi:uncharacterized protein K02A2.6-like [Paramacrobiotus metropolitanus]|uniref:uncharacterized protein K02A2.6-like n=1 Tax=Paramacrobiotus metropolitanus TaxID=2943436 RepID=UPI002445CB77|nr:uncharacterized protein K02A2.6-like [Paramacrobiotus metropolitanus]